MKIVYQIENIKLKKMQKKVNKNVATIDKKYYKV